MATKCLYIGKNEHLVYSLGEHFAVTVKTNNITALQFLLENEDVDTIIYEALEDDHYAFEFLVRFIKENFIHKNFFFVIANTKENMRNLFIKGVDDVFLKDVSSKDIYTRYQFIKKNALQLKLYKTPKEYKYKFPLWKRTFDILFSSIAILFLLPFFTIIAIAIRLESKGKVFYAAKRVGTGYKIFDFYKFRSMYTNADKKVDSLLTKNQYSVNESADISKEDNDGPLLFSDNDIVFENAFIKNRSNKQNNAFFKMVNDPRITKVGKFIRNTSIDELPQLFNVLKGDMSIVGNRPLPLYEAELLTTDRWSERFLAPAGLTGLWQVMKRGNSNSLSADERKDLDIQYAKNVSFLGDINIIFKTFAALKQHENV